MVDTPNNSNKMSMLEVSSKPLSSSNSNNSKWEDGGNTLLNNSTGLIFDLEDTQIKVGDTHNKV